MALIKCPECNHDVSEHAITCPNCGYQIQNTENKANNKKVKFTIVILSTFIIVMGIICLFFLIKNSSSKDNKESTLTGVDKAAYDIMMDLCKRADDPSNVQIISGTVTQMDEGYNIGTLKIKVGETIYNIITSNKEGDYQPSELQEELVSYAGDSLTDINFDKNKVQKAIDDYWG